MTCVIDSMPHWSIVQEKDEKKVKYAMFHDQAAKWFAHPRAIASCQCHSNLFWVSWSKSLQNWRRHTSAIVVITTILLAHKVSPIYWYDSAKIEIFFISPCFERVPESQKIDLNFFSRKCRGLWFWNFLAPFYGQVHSLWKITKLNTLFKRRKYVIFSKKMKFLIKGISIFWENYVFSPFEKCV